MSGGGGFVLETFLENKIEFQKVSGKNTFSLKLFIYIYFYFDKLVFTCYKTHFMLFNSDII